MRISRSRLISGSILLVMMLGLALFLRSPYVSNALKKAVLKELRAASGHQVIAAQMYVNMFPPFVGLNSLNVIDPDGERVMSAEKVKAYLTLSSILSGGISVDRIVISRMDLLVESLN